MPRAGLFVPTEPPDRAEDLACDLRQLRDTIPFARLRICASGVCVETDTPEATQRALADNGYDVVPRA